MRILLNVINCFGQISQPRTFHLVQASKLEGPKATGWCPWILIPAQMTASDLPSCPRDLNLFFPSQLMTPGNSQEDSDSQKWGEAPRLPKSYQPPGTFATFACPNYAPQLGRVCLMLETSHTFGLWTLQKSSTDIFTNITVHGCPRTQDSSTPPF